MRTIKRPVLILLITLWLFTPEGSAQNTQTYDSIYVSNGKNFLAKYEFYLSQGDTIYNGEFELNQQFENQEDIYEYLSVEGFFIENRADENWQLKKGSFAPSGSGYYNDYTYSYKVNGNEFMATGKFMAGKKIGDWKLYDWQIRDSKIKDTTFVATINFKDDKADGEFQLQFQNDILEGELDGNEKASGVWSFYRLNKANQKILLKEWVFKENVLVAKRLIRNQEIQQINFDDPGNNSLSEKKILLDQDFLEIIELKARISNEELHLTFKEEDGISDLYFILLDNLELVDKTFSPILKNNIKPAIVTILKAAELDTIEQDLLQKIRLQYEENLQQTKLILNNPQFNIASVSTCKVSQFKNVLEDIKDYFLAPTYDILSLYDDDQLKFFNRNQLIQYKIDLYDETAINKVFKSDSLSRSYEIKADLNFSAKQSNLSKLATLMESLGIELKLIEENLQQFLEEFQEEEKLVALENAMLAKYENTKHLADSLITGEHDNFAGIDVTEAIIKFADAELAMYSNLPTSEEKIRAIEPLINCFNRTEELIYTINKAPESIYKINEAYTKEVFNPYTFTNMEEKSKPSIYKAFNKLLLPGIFQNMQRLTCDNMAAYQANFKILYEEMINVLNEENTNRMERKVKRAKTPAKASEVLEMELSF
ncbi:hypothetical protein SAMN05661096_02710 [Marivirga sericea]|uniref:MORN repeat variant n=1 Tax=Marivirga sericea TaxID=1028 RepID=A0A1X7KGG7_9BACT|nr:hypothetical protein [Marivirga sericea]SMG40053.1 hypothetical protein SAMN05661096_02710 [Marivirga sericea]